MHPPSDPSQHLQKLFRRRKCWMLADLAAALGCAFISVRRLLKRIGYFRSFSDNGKWYTLPGLPRFNPEGIWHHRGIGFSQHGTLTATLTHLVERSATGHSARELSEKLQHPCHPVLTHLHGRGDLDRLKVGREFRYLSPRPDINRGQRESLAIQSPQPSAGPLSTQTVVRVLVEYIKDPELDFEQLARKVRQQGQVAVAAGDIAAFFRQHGLKKTPPARRSPL